MGDNATEEKLSPPQGSVKSYAKLLTLLESRSVSRVDTKFLKDLEIAKGNEGKLVAGLKFLGLIDQDCNARDSLNDLNIKGEKRKENLEKVIREAYSYLFDEVKFRFDTADADTLINSFKTEYKMGSLTTAERAARVFVFLAQQAGINLSEDITTKFSSSIDRARKRKQTPNKPRENRKREKPAKSQQESDAPIPEDALALISVKGVGNIYVTDKDTYELARNYMRLLAKKLDISDE